MKKQLTNVKIRLVQKGMTQKDLAKKIGISEEYLSKIIKKNNAPSVYIAIKIAKELESSVEYLFNE